MPSRRQAVLDRAHDPAPRAALLRGRRRRSACRTWWPARSRWRRLPSALPRNSSDLVAAVDVGGVEEGDAGVDAPRRPRPACAFWSMRMPKLLQPSPTSLTFRPEAPSRRIFIVVPPQIAASGRPRGPRTHCGAADPSGFQRRSPERSGRPFTMLDGQFTSFVRRYRKALGRNHHDLQSFLRGIVDQMRVVTIVSLGASAVLGLAALFVAKTVLPNAGQAKAAALAAASRRRRAGRRRQARPEVRRPARRRQGDGPARAGERRAGRRLHDRRRRCWRRTTAARRWR